jgi:ssDNA-binding Zn-finger/Zn-ribbon topoisomerase 1
MQRRGKFGAFVACDQYPNCKTTFKLPSSGLIKNSEKICEHCQHPMILVLQKRRKQEICLNSQCPGKTNKEEEKEIKNIEQNKVERKCPKCGKGLVVRSSVYGKFLACPGYPACRHIEKITNVDKSVSPAAAEKSSPVQKKEEAKESITALPKAVPASKIASSAKAVSSPKAVPKAAKKK